MKKNNGFLDSIDDVFMIIFGLIGLGIIVLGYALELIDEKISAL
ncbi:MAG: hypothetical protein PHI45_01985 [Candidatus Pacebacteria bacterium]|jgi:hypothetical protein|nr:hypothetical protein [Candidatus Paceibacterota bacterium]MDD5012780.1 hypothetical protein [Candidatus Paceibacterota bacterium]MDD5752830.1 hypothetical protein [Candidatus Paceibacterota bacterium]